MVSQQTPPKPDALQPQRERQTRTARNRKFGALAAAAAIGIAGVIVAVQAPDDGRDTKPVVTSPPTLTATPDTRRDLYLVDPETGRTTLLLAAPGNQTDPERSPDGARVVYVSKPPGLPPQIFVLEPDGTERQLTTLEQGAQDPTWSPDGRQIAFAGRVSAYFGLALPSSDIDIFVMNADGSRIRRLAGTPEHDSHPDWSPDGAQIAFQSGVNLGTLKPTAVSTDISVALSDIWVATIPDGTLTQLPSKGYRDHGADPAWSPDGHWIAITVFEGSTLNGEFPYASLQLVRPDGTEAHRLGDRNPYGHWRQNSSWSPDGRSIVFEDNNWLGLGAGGSIHIIDVETGEDSVRFVPTEGGESFPSWDTEGILFSRIGSD